MSQDGTNMIDQATRLRGLMESRTAAGVLSEPRTSARDFPRASCAARVIAVTGGKGGVGKSNLALNLAVALRRSGKRTCLIDANGGVSNIDLLCGLNAYWNLSHVFTGARRLSEILLKGPEDISIVSGASGLVELIGERAAAHADLLRQLELLEAEHDFLIIDTGAGIHRNVRVLATAADIALLVTTPEPTSIAETYATAKALSADPPPAMLAVVNQASSGQAEQIIDRLQRTARLFLKTTILAGGGIPADSCVPASVVRRQPLLLCSPRSAAAAAIARFAQRLRCIADNHAPRGCFFHRILERPRREAA